MQFTYIGDLMEYLKAGVFPEPDLIGYDADLDNNGDTSAWVRLGTVDSVNHSVIAVQGGIDYHLSWSTDIPAADLDKDTGVLGIRGSAAGFFITVVPPGDSLWIKGKAASLKYTFMIYRVKYL